MANDNPRYVFFDIGGTLGRVQFSTAGDKIDHIDVFTEVPEVLRTLNDRGVGLGIISDPGPIGPNIVKAALDAAGLLQFFDSSLIVFGVKDSTSIFLEAIGLAGQKHAPQNCLFVGENANERDFAQLAGLRTANSPSEALELS